MNNFKFSLFLCAILNSFLIYAQIGIGTPIPHSKASLHLAEENKTLILNKVSNKDLISNPYEGMIFYDVKDECFRGFAAGEYTDCFGAKPSEPVVRVDGPGFKGVFVRGKVLSNATFEVAVSNNTFREVTLGFHIDDLQIDESTGVQVSKVSTQGVSSRESFDLNFAAGSAKTIVYSLTGVPNTPFTEILGIWNKIVLSYEDAQEVVYESDCALGTWTSPLPSINNGLLKNGETYNLVYSVPIPNSEGYVFDDIQMSQSGLTLSRSLTNGATDANLIYTISGTYNGVDLIPVDFGDFSGCDFIIGRYAKSCKEIKENLPNSISGVYKIDVDHSNVLLPMNCYCDMDTDGGGWSLILNYLHKEKTNPSLRVLTNQLPLQDNTILGIDESNTNSWGHIGNSLASKFDFTEVRFYGVTSSNLNKVMHFKTSLSNVISYIKNGTGNMNGIGGSFMPIGTHTTILPGVNPYNNNITEGYGNRGDNALTEFPFWQSGGPNWSIRTKNSSGLECRWEVDDFWHTTGTDVNSPSTHHQVWIR